MAGLFPAVSVREENSLNCCSRFYQKCKGAALATRALRSLLIASERFLMAP